MRTILLATICSVVSLAAERAPVRETTAPPRAVTIPAGATQVSDNTFEHRDAQGRAWIYRKTPFGVMKNEKSQSEAPAAVARPGNTNPFGGKETGPTSQTLVKATVDGDTVRFERSSPFGPQKWTKKKADLTADEQKILETSPAGK